MRPGEEEEFKCIPLHLVLDRKPRRGDVKCSISSNDYRGPFVLECPIVLLLLLAILMMFSVCMCTFSYVDFSLTMSPPTPSS